MARAKHTDRAAARRRHRAQLAASEPAIPEDHVEPAVDAPAAARAATPARDRQALTPERPAPAGGIRKAFGGAFRPLNLREDLALLPTLLRNKAFWLPVLLMGLTAGAVVAFQGRELISRFAATYFLTPPPLGAIFLAGFLAPRASYLIGALVGVVSSIFIAVAAANLPIVEGAAPTEVALYSLTLSPIAGIFMAAAAAWYRRFLYLASPARQMAAQRRPAPPRGKPVRGR